MAATRRRSTRSSLKDSPGGAPRKPGQPARMSVILPLAGIDQRWCGQPRSATLGSCSVAIADGRPG
jgi:hypothetical protein